MTGVSPHEVFIALGSNIGDRAENLANALTRLQGFLEVIEKSSIYETPPWGILEQPAFLNQVIRGTTILSPVGLLDSLKKIENEMGRVKTVRNGPRIIDLDILLYDDLQISNPNLTIPHARMYERAFVLVPLAEIAPKRLIPGTVRSVEEFLEDADKSGIHKFANKDPDHEIPS
jgi:2-amino-4-hydroxy-6-hydroxymethyldihydropteridine diphosphokinase